mgnify:CR=1 FL=1
MGGATQLWTYAATRNIRILYFDGQSAALGDQGWMDAQDLLLFGEVHEAPHDEQGHWEAERLRVSCELAEEYGFDATVRMNAG